MSKGHDFPDVTLVGILGRFLFIPTVITGQARELSSLSPRLPEGQEGGRKPGRVITSGIQFDDYAIQAGSKTGL